jgi:hypothetical protein
MQDYEIPFYHRFDVFLKPLFTLFPTVSASFMQKKFFRQRAHANPFSDHALDYPSPQKQSIGQSTTPHLLAQERSQNLLMLAAVSGDS